MTYKPVPASLSNPKSQQPPENINKAITQCGLQIAQAVHNLGTAIADGGIEKAQAGQLIEEKLGLTAQHRHFFWRIHETYTAAPYRIGTSLRRDYLETVALPVLEAFRPCFLSWCRDENRIHSNLTVKPDSIECNCPGDVILSLSQMTVRQARIFKYLSVPVPPRRGEEPPPFHDPCRDPYPEGSIFHIPDTPDDDYDAFALLLNGVTATPPPVVPLVTYPHDDVSLLFTDEELGL